MDVPALKTYTVASPGWVPRKRLDRGNGPRRRLRIGPGNVGVPRRSGLVTQEGYACSRVARSGRDLRGPEGGPQPRADDVGEERAPPAGEQRTQARAQRRAPENDALRRSYAEEGYRRAYCAREEAGFKLQTGEDERQQGDEAHGQKGAEGGEGGADWVGPLDFEAELFGEHGVHPETRVVSYDGDHLLEGLAGEALLGVDLAHLLALSRGDLGDLAFLAQARLLDGLDLAPGPLVVADGHAEPVGKQVGESEDHDHDAGESPAHGPGHHGERGNTTVYAAQDRVAQVPLPPPLREAPAHGLGSMLLFQPGPPLAVQRTLTAPRQAGPVAWRGASGPRTRYPSGRAPGR